MVSAFISLGALSFVVFQCSIGDSFYWFWLVVLCSLWIRDLAYGMGRKLLSDLHGTSPILMEIGHWNIVFCVSSIFAVFDILAISMARSKNTGKGKAPSSSMEWAVKKRKSNTSQTIKNGQWKVQRFFI